MEQETKGQKLQQAYRQLIEPYSSHLQIAATLTLKQKTKIRRKRFSNYGDEVYEFWQWLNEDVLNSQIRYFTARLTALLLGNNCRRKSNYQNAMPLVIVVTEGRNIASKRVHLHLALGNIPVEKLTDIEKLVLKAWKDCDFSYKENKIVQISNAFGWLGYITKEVGYTDDDVIDIVASTIPPFIQQNI